jgi:hypothetical protein
LEIFFNFYQIKGATLEEKAEYFVKITKAKGKYNVEKT